MEAVLVKVLTSVVIAVVTLAGAVLVRLVQVYGARLAESKIGLRLGIIKVLADKAAAIVHDLETTTVAVLKRSSENGKLSREDAVYIKAQAMLRLKKAATELSNTPVLTDNELSGLIESTLKWAKLSGGTPPWAPPAASPAPTAAPPA